MKRCIRQALIGVLLLMVSGCTTVPFKRTELVPVKPTTTAAVVDNLWSSGSGRYLVRQSGLFEIRGRGTPMEGMIRLDLDKKQGRLVALNEMGVKLFDLSVDAAGSEALFVIPELKSYPGFTEAVATSVRRIFLDPQPSSMDSLSIGKESYLLSRTGNDRVISFLIGGRDGQLLEKSCSSDSEKWQVRYFEYRREQQLPPFPRGIVLDDELAGYRLTLWLESVEKTDE